MANVLFKRGNTATINSTAVTDGQLLYNTTTGQHYIDSDSTRKEVGKPVVNTTAEVSAITADNIPCGTKPVKELITSLNAPTVGQFIYDYQNGVAGYNTESDRGADTFHPFSSKRLVASNLKTLTLLKNETITITIPTGNTEVLLMFGGGGSAVGPITAAHVVCSYSLSGVVSQEELYYQNAQTNASTSSTTTYCSTLLGGIKCKVNNGATLTLTLSFASCGVNGDVFINAYA